MEQTIRNLIAEGKTVKAISELRYHMRQILFFFLICVNTATITAQNSLEKDKPSSMIERAEKMIRDFIERNYDEQDSFCMRRLDIVRSKDYSKLSNVEVSSYPDSISKINSEMIKVGINRKYSMQLVHKIAEELSVFDKTKASSDAKKADQLFLDGDMFGAYNALDEEKLKQCAKEGKAPLSQTINDYLQKGHLAIIIGRLTDAERFYTEGVRLDENNVESLDMWAYFLSKRETNPISVRFYEKSLVSTNPKATIGALCISIGASYQRQIRSALMVTEERTNAEQYFLRAFSIYEELAKTNIAFEPDLAETERYLGEFYRTFAPILKAENYFKLSFDLYERLAKNNPHQFEPHLASIAGDIAVFNNTNNMTMGAEKYFFLSVDIYERLAKRDSVQYEFYLAKALDNLGGYYEGKKQLKEAHTSYSRALVILQNILLNKQLDYFDEYDPIVREYKLVFARMRNIYPPDMPIYDSIKIELHQEFVKSIEILRGINRDWEMDALLEYSNISRLALFTKNFSLAETAARQMNELDKGTKRTSSTLANALLFQGKEDEAKKEYLILVNTKIDWNKPWRDMLLEDFDVLENRGMDKTQLDKARKWVNE